MMKMKNLHVLTVQCQSHLQVWMMTIVTVLMEQMNQVLTLLFHLFFPFVPRQGQVCIILKTTTKFKGKIDELCW